MSIVRIQEPEQLVRDYAAYIDGDRSKEEVLSEDLRFFGPGLPVNGSQGREAYREMLRGHLTAFPDLKHRIDTIATAGNAVLTEWTVVGTHTGDFAGIPASGKRITMRTAAVYVVKDGRIVEERAYFNIPDLVAQIAPS